MGLEHQGVDLVYHIGSRSEVRFGEAVERSISQVVGFYQRRFAGIHIQKSGDEPVVALGLFELAQGFEAVGWIIAFSNFLKFTTEPSCMFTSRTSPSSISRSSTISLRGAMKVRSEAALRDPCPMHTNDRHYPGC